MKRRKIKRKDNKLYIFLLILLVLIFIGSMAIIIKWIYETYKSKEILTDIVSDVIVNEENNISIYNNNDNNTENEQLKIDFDKLLSINNQVVCWIKIENTSIDYPVVKGNDNSYYLYNNILKENSQNGWIFMDYRNNENLTDNNTILFGHNIKSGIMFSDLKKIYNGEIKDDIYIDIYTKDGNKKRYLVYSCYMDEPDDYSINPDISDKNYDIFAQNMKARSIYDYNVELSQSKTLTLSTCDNTGTMRIIVHGITYD